MTNQYSASDLANLQLSMNPQDVGLTDVQKAVKEVSDYYRQIAQNSLLTNPSQAQFWNDAADIFEEAMADAPNVLSVTSQADKINVNPTATIASLKSLYDAQVALGGTFFHPVAVPQQEATPAPTQQPTTITKEPSPVGVVAWNAQYVPLEEALTMAAGEPGDTAKAYQGLISNLTMYGLQGQAPDWKSFFESVGANGLQYTMAAVEQQTGLGAKLTGQGGVVQSPIETPAYLGQPGTTQYPFLTMPEVLNPDQAKAKGIDIPDGWFVKLTPDTSERGYSVTYIGPDQSQIPEGQVYQDTAGNWLTPTQVQAQQTAANDLNNLFKDAFPEGVVGIPDIQSLLQWAHDSPEGFGNAIEAEGDNPKTEALLKYIYPSITQDQIDQIFHPSAPVPSATAATDALYMAIQDVFPAANADDILTKAQNSSDDFFASLAAIGDTPDVENLLNTMYPDMTDVQKNWIFKTDAEKTQWLEDTATLGNQRNDVVKAAFPSITDEEINTIYGNLALANAQSPVEAGFGPQQESGVYNWGDITMPQGGLAPLTTDLLAPFKDIIKILDKYVDRPWEVAVMQVQQVASSTMAPISSLLGQQGDPMDAAVVQELQANRDKYGFWGALVSQDVPDIWNDFAKTQPGGKVSTTILDLLNPVYFIPVGGAFGLAADFTSKIPIIGDVLTEIAGGVQAVETGMTAPISAVTKAVTENVGKVIAPVIKGAAEYTGDALAAIGQEIGDVAVKQLIDDSGHLLLKLPTTDDLLSSILAPNWMKTVVQTVAEKIPGAQSVIETTLGKRILIDQGVEDVENAVGQAAIAKGAIDRMGVDAATLKTNELASMIGDDRAFFGFTGDNAYSDIMAQRILPEYADEKGVGTLEHVYQNPEKYDWTGKEIGQTYIERVKEVNKQVTALLVKEGVEPKTVTQDYIKRIVEGYTEPETGKFIPVKGTPGIKSTSVGGKAAYEMHRQFETMADGIAAGYTYNQSMRASVSAYIQEAFRKIGDQRALTEMSSELEKLGLSPRTTSEIMAEQYPDLVAKWGTISKDVSDLNYISDAVKRAARGEQLPAATLTAIETRSPEIAQRIQEIMALPEGERATQFKALSKEINQAIGVKQPVLYETKGELQAKTELARQPSLTEGYLMQAFAGGKKYDREFIDSFNKFFGYKPGIGALQSTADIAGVLRITKAALDFSAMTIQGMPSWGLAHATLLTDPATGIKLVGEWYKAYAYSIATFFDPGLISKYIAKNMDSEMSRIAATGSSRAIDYFSAMEATRGLGGLAEKAMAKIPLHPFERAEATFYAGGEVVRDTFWKILSPQAIKEGKEIELAKFLDNLTGLADSKSAMVPLTARQLEGAFAWFAPNYTRSCLTLLADIFRGGLTGDMARKSLAGMIGAGATFYAATVYSMTMLEGATNEQAMDRILAGFGVVQDPITGGWSWKTSGAFMSLPVGNYNFGLGGFWYGLISLASSIDQSLAQTGSNKRTDFLSLSRANPFVQWWYNRASPVVGLVSDLKSHTTYMGDPIEGPTGYTKYILGLFEPIWVEQGINPLIPKQAKQYEVPEGTLAKAAVPVLNLLGLRVNPDSLWTKFYDTSKPLITRITDDMLTQYVDPNGVNPDLLQKYKDARDKGTLAWADLPKLLQSQLLTMYPDLNTAYNTALDDSKKRDTPLWQNWTADTAAAKTTYYQRGDDLWNQLLSGQINTQTLRQEWSDAGTMYGTSIDTIENSSVYKAIYDQLNALQSDGSKDSQYMDLALQDYDSVMYSDYVDDLGNYDWDAKNAAVQGFIDKWGQDVYHLVQQMYTDKKLQAGLNPALVQLSSDKDVLNDYWNLPYVTSDDQAARLAYRQNNPQVDALLTLWGYSQNIQTKAAYDILVKEADQLGIPLSSIKGLPPENIATDYFNYQALTSATDRLTYRQNHPQFEAWGEVANGWTPIGDRGKVVTTPTETPTPTPESTIEPVPTAKSIATPKPTTIKPVTTPKPTATPKPAATPKATATPKPTVAPTPTATPVPDNIQKMDDEYHALTTATEKKQYRYDHPDYEAWGEQTYGWTTLKVTPTPVPADLQKMDDEYHALNTAAEKKQYRQDHPEYEAWGEKTYGWKPLD